MAKIFLWLDSFGQLDLSAAAVIAALFMFASFVPIPRTFLVLGAGAAFGLQAILVVIPSTTLGGILAFQLARRLLRGWVERQIDTKPLWRVLAGAIDAESWHIAALMRFWGPAPNCVQNYVFALTNIGVLPYSLITLVFTVPQIVLYTYIGTFSGAILRKNGELPFSSWLMAPAAAVVLAIIYLVSRRIRTILNAKSSAAIFVPTYKER